MENTRRISLIDNNEKEMRAVMQTVYAALREKGYDPINQIVGYIITEDPTYITNCGNARALIRLIDRDELMAELVKNYLELE